MLHCFMVTQMVIIIKKTSQITSVLLNGKVQDRPTIRTNQTVRIDIVTSNQHLQELQLLLIVRVEIRLFTAQDKADGWMLLDSTRMLNTATSRRWSFDRLAVAWNKLILRWSASSTVTEQCISTALFASTNQRSMTRSPFSPSKIFGTVQGGSWQQRLTPFLTFGDESGAITRSTILR